MIHTLTVVLPLVVAILGLATAVVNLVSTVRRTRFDAFEHRRQVKRRTRRVAARRARHRRR